MTMLILKTDKILKIENGFDLNKFEEFFIDEDFNKISIENLPKKVQTILNSYNDNKELYNECVKIDYELNKIGYGANYNLSGKITYLYKYKKSYYASMVLQDLDNDEDPNYQKSLNIAIKDFKKNLEQELNHYI